MGCVFPQAVNQFAERALNPLQRRSEKCRIGRHRKLTFNCILSERPHPSQPLETTTESPLEEAGQFRGRPELRDRLKLFESRRERI